MKESYLETLSDSIYNAYKHSRLYSASLNLIDCGIPEKKVREIFHKNS